MEGKLAKVFLDGKEFGVIKITINFNKLYARSRATIWYFLKDAEGRKIFTNGPVICKKTVKIDSMYTAPDAMYIHLTSIMT